MIFFTIYANTIVALVFLLSLSNHVPDVLALQCYVCNSRKPDESDCTTFSDKFVKECPSDAVACRKFVYSIDLAGNGDLTESVARQCALTKWDFGCKSLYGTNGKRYHVDICECVEDKCNRASKVRFLSMYVMCILAVVTVLNLIV